MLVLVRVSDTVADIWMNKSFSDQMTGIPESYRLFWLAERWYFYMLNSQILFDGGGCVRPKLEYTSPSPRQKIWVKRAEQFIP
jgi:hypothetical protein